MRPPRHLVIAAAVLTVISASTLVIGLGSAGCPSETTEASVQLLTPGVFIQSVGSFATNLLAGVREANPACR